MTKLFRLLLVLAAGLWLAGCQQGRDAYALTSTGTLIKFQTDQANQIDAEVPISGLNSGDALLQIDFRPSNKQLYGLTSAARIVTIDTGSGAVTYVGSGPFTTGHTLNLPVMNINPTPPPGATGGTQTDYMRVIDYQASSGNYNGEIDLDTGLQIQQDSTSLSFKTNDTNAGEVPHLVAIAHTDKEVNATQTTLYGLELNTQSLVTISTSGVLTTVAATSRGFTVNSGFSIVPNNDLPYVVVNDSGSSASFYGLDLSSALIDNGKTIGGSRQILSLAVTLDQPKKDGFNL